MASKDWNSGQGRGLPKPGSFGTRNSGYEGEQNRSGANGGSNGRTESKKSPHGNRSQEVLDGSERILAFPSVSTLDFQFDIEIASTVLMEVVSEFLLEPENSSLRLMMVDLADSTMLSTVRKKASDLGLDQHRFFTHVGDITKLRSSGGPACRVIANAANDMLRPGGGGVNQAIYDAAGPALNRATKEARPSQMLPPGAAVLVRLPKYSPLYHSEGVTHVIHVLGPNMNPRRPNYLNDNYNKGRRQLRYAYKNLFKNFALYASETIKERNARETTKERNVGENVRLGGSDRSQNSRESASVTSRNSSASLSSSASSASLSSSASGAFRVAGVSFASATKGSASGTSAGASKHMEIVFGNFEATVVDAANSPRENASFGMDLNSKISTAKPNEISVIEKAAARASTAKDFYGYSDHDLTFESTSNLEVQTESAEAHLNSGLDGLATGGNGEAELDSTGYSDYDSTSESASDAEVQTESGPDGVTAGENRCSLKWEPWTLALFNMAMHPEQHTNLVLQTTDDAVVARDAYPKAKQHIRVLSRMSGLDGVEDLQSKHIPLLKHMHTLGEEWAASLLKKDPSLTFRLGYHSVSSMRQLHLHVISQDFDSPFLKNKKHWNSFTTSFFLDSLEVIHRLEEKGGVQIDLEEAEAVLEAKLRCHRCSRAHPTFPLLKQHISVCSKPLPKNSHLITLVSSRASAQRRRAAERKANARARSKGVSSQFPVKPQTQGRTQSGFFSILNSMADDT